MNLSPGTQLGQFEISSLLGVGGMGEVYRARDTKLGRDVAIKILPEEFSKDRDRLARFEREAKTLASLNHPNIGALYDFLEEDGIRFLILELIEGETLSDRMAKDPLSVKEALPLFIQIAEALGAAHEKGIVHRDLKPDNIKITPDDTVKILDFGIARSYQATTHVSRTDATRSMDPTKLTASGTILGTPAYMSPEQVRGQNVDRRSDVWAFGCCLYEALTGISPFHADTIADMFGAILEQEPDWDALPQTATESVRNLVRRCLEKEPRRRLRDTSDIALQLEQSLSTLRGRAQAGESKSFDELLDWRPEAGEPVPGRKHWILESKVGEGGFGEVWLAAHKKTKTKRVFKYCFDPERVRSLKREVVLFRLLKESLGDRDDIAQVIDWEFDRPPYFLESEYTEGGDLRAWAEKQGGVGDVSMEMRLDLMVQVAVALGAAHGVGVLHKDVKPANILITEDKETGQPRARLTDFGIGLITNRDALREKGITATGLTETLADSDSSSKSGTRLYMAPEVIEGKQPTTLSDIYALGVVLYQMVIGDFSRAIAPGWERDVKDEFLRDDIAACVDGAPERRLSSATELAERLRRLEQRRAEREAERRAKKKATEAKRIAELGRRRRRQFAVASIVGISAIILAATTAIREFQRAEEQVSLRSEAEQARRSAELESNRANLEAELNTQIVDYLLNLLGSSQDPQIANLNVREAFVKWSDQIENTPIERPVFQLSLLNAFGDVYRDFGDFDRAVRLHKKALEIAESSEIEPTGYRERLQWTVKSSLGRDYMARDDLGDSELKIQTTREARFLAVRAFGSESVEFLQSTVALHYVLGLEGSQTRAEAETLLREASDLCDDLYGDQWNFIRLQLHLLWGRHYRRDENYVEAEKNFREVEAMLDSGRYQDGSAFERSPLSYYEERLQLFFNMQILYWSMKSVDRSIEYGRKNVLLFDQQRGRHRTRDTLITRGTLIFSLRMKASDLFVKGELKESAEFYQEALDLTIDLYGEEHENVVLLQRELAQVTKLIRKSSEEEARNGRQN